MGHWENICRMVKHLVDLYQTSINDKVKNVEMNLIDHDDQGCDASLLLDDTSSFTGEKTALANNNSARGFDVIDTIKTQVESVCPGVVSCADILAIAARDSVVALGGKSWTVQLGRRDATTASLSTANNDIPRSTFSLSQLISNFSNKGLSAKEMVTLSGIDRFTNQLFEKFIFLIQTIQFFVVRLGSHTIGQARCTIFRARIYNDTNINTAYATTLKSNCPITGSDGNLDPIDTTSPNTFDNSYYKNLVCSKGLLHSDQELYSNGSTDAQVTSYSRSPSTFLTDFAVAMVKMGNISPLTGKSGQIRTDCRKIN
ncbi:hypothetical protein GIB67_020225 [Kingdonia uniflora]|uniref:Peroxidase n=1 Tax=Kingdonia uniflora TaxID=39325 RepID=A0A7J7P3Z6_9MAGN|nr:hypothetical protein GIB67_020225 [Kingdonia uniflora]